MFLLFNELSDFAIIFLSYNNYYTFINSQKKNNYVNFAICRNELYLV